MLAGGAGGELLTGGPGDDVITGGDGDDQLADEPSFDPAAPVVDTDVYDGGTRRRRGRLHRRPRAGGRRPRARRGQRPGG